MNNKKLRFKLIPAVYLVFRRGNQVLLSQRANTGYQDGKYGLVAGHLKGDELATAAMVREAKEEAGVIIKLKDLKFVHVLHRLSRGEPGEERMDLFFETYIWQGKITNAEPEKCGDLSWHDLDNLPDNMLPLVKKALEDLTKGVNYSEYETEPE